MATEADILLPVIGKLPPRWRAVEFGAVLDGGTRNGIYKTKEFHGRGAKMVNMGELFGHPRLRNVEMRRVELNENELERFSIGAGDLLFARRSLVAEGAGKCCIVLEANETTTFESSIIRARPNPKEADSLFLFYLFKSPFGTHVLGSILRHVAVAGITGSDLVKLRIPIPPLPEQRTIAQILNSLDEKIELNRRMNETLEALAQTIFKSWFVDAATTKLPKGWHKATLGEVATNTSESFKFSEFTEVVFVNTGDVLSGDFLHSNRISKIGLPGQAKKAIRQNDILFSEIRPGNRRFAFVDFQPDEYVVSTKFMVIRASDKIEPRILFRVLTSNETLEEFQIEAESRSGTFPQITFDSISRFKIIVPPIELQRAFVKEVAPLEARIKLNKEASRTLAELRDALLPKLLSGELRVPVK